MTQGRNRFICFPSISTRMATNTGAAAGGQEPARRTGTLSFLPVRMRKKEKGGWGKVNECFSPFHLISFSLSLLPFARTHHFMEIRRFSPTRCNKTLPLRTSRQGCDVELFGGGRDWEEDRLERKFFCLHIFITVTSHPKHEDARRRCLWRTRATASSRDFSRTLLSRFLEGE